MRGETIQMTRPRYLTKSRFKLGCECPTKLFFTGKSDYGDKKKEDRFLAALAEGGFQVGELAKLYHPGGVEIHALDSEQALRETSRLLQADSVVLYEPALRFGNLLVRVDILIKRGSFVELIEVKAKSFDPRDEEPFHGKRARKDGSRKLSSAWEPYLRDVAFQTYVARGAFPSWTVSPYLMMADKSSRATVDGINQRFLITRDPDNRARIEVAPGTQASDLGEKILVQVPVTEEVELILSQGINDMSFPDFVAFLSEAYRKDEMLAPQVGSQCRGCEFRIDDAMKATGLKSGFETCWKKAESLKDADFLRPFVFDLWNFRKSDNLLQQGKRFIDELSEEDISPTERPDEPGLSTSERQWLQVEHVIRDDGTSYLDREGLAEEISHWHFPLNFIDFETTMVALPFHRGRRPYEQIAFQFSHHVMTESGLVEHKTQYLQSERGVFPNFAFVRALRAALSRNDGTIFRYAAHENTVLCQILAQLRESDEPDRDELCAWIRSITRGTADSTEPWEGERKMVDLCEIVKRYDYHPATKGSNSIKAVLPAILADSDFLQERYGRPIYGSASGIPSHNFRDWTWIRKGADGRVVDPYKLLPKVFADLEPEAMERLLSEGSLADGGAAMTAYARMQFSQMSAAETERVRAALLKYCELDTFAMVLLVEHWMHEIDGVREGVRPGRVSEKLGA